MLLPMKKQAVYYLEKSPHGAGWEILYLLAKKGWGLKEAKHDWLGNEHL